ncbi:hypothetical protein EDEG_03253 [Edhazardia aedis USNM 41457]|uniref:CDT1 Geminin-binding domain-containing protein n=1 Tax=Edhazardia aedis (strain USNM 41457) TaxID=1003232 RepID=J8ZRH9_EDHAE|nr:hypothetical protein EDEG_03253 [Edhazardia aedis USNM 41457]|eukprot:EJW02303.1 hypothetical protein EDEG_03253 [Edhazardia aedis USNM 41457]
MKKAILMIILVIVLILIVMLVKVLVIILLLVFIVMIVIIIIVFIMTMMIVTVMKMMATMKLLDIQILYMIVNYQMIIKMKTYQTLYLKTTQMMKMLFTNQNQDFFTLNKKFQIQAAQKIFVFSDKISIEEKTSFYYETDEKISNKRFKISSDTYIENLITKFEKKYAIVCRKKNFCCTNNEKQCEVVATEASKVASLIADPSIRNKMPKECENTVRKGCVKSNVKRKLTTKMFSNGSVDNNSCTIVESNNFNSKNSNVAVCESNEVEKRISCDLTDNKIEDVLENSSDSETCEIKDCVKCINNIINEIVSECESGFSKKFAGYGLKDENCEEKNSFDDKMHFKSNIIEEVCFEKDIYDVNFLSSVSNKDIQSGVLENEIINLTDNKNLQKIKETEKNLFVEGKNICEKHEILEINTTKNSNATNNNTNTNDKNTLSTINTTKTNEKCELDMKEIEISEKITPKKFYKPQKQKTDYKLQEVHDETHKIEKIHTQQSIPFTKITKKLYFKDKILKLSKIYSGLLTIQRFNQQKGLKTIFATSRKSLEKMVNAEIYLEDIENINFLYDIDLYEVKIDINGSKITTFSIYVKEIDYDKVLWDYLCCKYFTFLNGRKHYGHTFMYNFDVENVDIPRKQLFPDKNIGLNTNSEIKVSSNISNINTSTDKNSNIVNSKKFKDNNSENQNKSESVLNNAKGKLKTILDRIKEKEQKRKEEFIKNSSQLDYIQEIKVKIDNIFVIENKKCLKVCDIIKLLDLFKGKDVIDQLCISYSQFTVKIIQNEAYLFRKN